MKSDPNERRRVCRALAAGAVGLSLSLGGGILLPGVASAVDGTTPQSPTWHQSDGNVDWTVPPGVCAVDWTIQGGAGGAGRENSNVLAGGLGGTVRASMQVAAGDHFFLQAGGKGGDFSFGGALGGKSGLETSGGDAPDGGSGGGGASFVRHADAGAPPILVAGGGGGAGGGNTGNPVTFDATDAVGGAGGDEGVAGGDLPAAYGTTGGAGGTAATAGAGGAITLDPAYGQSGQAGHTIFGGSAAPYAGGGGGGYLGGGGGANGSVPSGQARTGAGAGGGGGGNFVDSEIFPAQSVSLNGADANASGDGFITAALTDCSPISNPNPPVVTTPTAPSAPTLSSATSATAGEVDLVIVPGAAVQGLPVDRYKVSTNGTDGPWTTIETQPEPETDNLTATVKGLEGGKTYDIAVQAWSDDVASAVSNVEHVTVTSVNSQPTNPEPQQPTNPQQPTDPQPQPQPEPPVTTVPDKGGSDVDVSTPGAPTGLSATAERSSVLVSWKAPATGGKVDHYEVMLMPTGQTVSTKELSARFGAVAGEKYTATVVAVSAGKVAGPGVSATTQTAADAPVVPDEVPAAPLTLTTDKGQISATTPGAKLTVIGTGFLPHSTATIVIYSEPQVLGTATTDAQGNFAKEVEVPATLAAGQHSLVASGTAPDGTERFMRMNVTVAAAAATVDPGTPAAGTATPAPAPAPAAAAKGLAYTGATVLVPAGLGLTALVGGGVLLLVSRRRRAA